MCYLKNELIKAILENLFLEFFLGKGNLDSRKCRRKKGEDSVVGMRKLWECALNCRWFSSVLIQGFALLNELLFDSWTTTVCTLCPMHIVQSTRKPVISALYVSTLKLYCVKWLGNWYTYIYLIYIFFLCIKELLKWMNQSHKWAIKNNNNSNKFYSIEET